MRIKRPIINGFILPPPAGALGSSWGQRRPPFCPPLPKMLPIFAILTRFELIIGSLFADCGQIYQSIYRLSLNDCYFLIDLN